MNAILRCTLLIVLVGLLCFWGCSDSGDDAKTAVVSGYVVETWEGPVVAGSTLTVVSSGQSVQNDSTGYFSLSIKKGPFVITADKNGFAQSQWQDLSLECDDQERIVICQPRLFCSDWEAKAPAVTIEGLDPYMKIKGTVKIAIRARGSHPISKISLNLGNIQQESLAVAQSGSLDFSWDSSSLPDGQTYVLIAATDINNNNTRIKIPVILENRIVNDVVPGAVTDIDPNFYTVVVSRDGDEAEDPSRGSLVSSYIRAHTNLFSSMRWKAVPGASGYRVYRAGGPAEKPVLIDLLYGNESIRFSDFDPGLLPGMTLHYFVSAFNNKGEGPRSAAPPLTALDRFDVNLISPSDNESGISTVKPVFEWGPGRPVGDIQVYRLLLIGYNDIKDAYTWDTTIQNTTRAVFDGELLPATVYHWDIVNAYAAKDPVANGRFRSYSLPGPFKKDPYSSQFQIVTSSQNGSFTFTSDRSGGGQQVASPRSDSIIVRLRRGEKPEQFGRAHGLTLKKSFQAGTITFGVYDTTGIRERGLLMRGLADDPRVIYAEPTPTYRFDWVPNDPYYHPWQYCHIKMQTEKAWDITIGGGDVIMAIIDTGLDGTHPEFAGRQVTGHNFSTDEDVPPGVHFDSYGHGTHVAGIAGATGDNGIGIAGVNWRSRIMPLKVNDEGEEVAEYVVESIPWAVDHHAVVLNMSLGSPGYSQALQDVITYACQQGVSVVVSMGNNSTGVVQFPAACQGVIPVGSTDGRDKPSAFTTWGSYISLSAPGDEIYSCSKRDHGYMAASGTSMSTPQVVGAVALLKSIHPDWSIEEIRSQLEWTADDVGEAGFDKRSGWGRLNVYRLLSAPKAPNRYGRVRIFAKDPTGTGIDGADVIMYGPGGKTVATVKTDSDGYAHFFYIPAGSGYEATGRLRNFIGQTSSPFDLVSGSENPDVEIVIETES